MGEARWRQARRLSYELDLPARNSSLALSMNGWNNPDYRLRTPRRAGFTLVDLLAVMVSICLLAALALPALAGSKGRTKIGQCASNLKQFALASHLYANDNSDRLPLA